MHIDANSSAAVRTWRTTEAHHDTVSVTSHPPKSHTGHINWMFTIWSRAVVYRTSSQHPLAQLAAKWA